MIISTCFGRTTYEQILHNKPVIDRSYAKRLAQEFNEAADKYKVPANVLAAIAMTESSYILDAVNAKSDDYGLMQINKFNIKAYKFDKQRLLEDLEYSIDAGAKVFQWFYRRWKLEEAVKRYNCGTRKSCVNWKGPVSYWKKVLRYL